ncbi:uncharacterized protein BYT42DRAFT_548944 [Radiomyces spectabilis]|uniref:uncharacterized protein n=1 Tax=Radiomyces spectabilis TaxID=64574 RepID=UPI00221F6136|nr:uncharacterized protein BYT42DRAFT_548944 [Radiomyces spectabilis]KAI8370732.1 hypothetical protein BYT42DRAFT_548944 [Radiomyces spectabilis]
MLAFVPCARIVTNSVHDTVIESSNSIDDLLAPFRRNVTSSPQLTTSAVMPENASSQLPFAKINWPSKEIWNRDINAAINMRRILMAYISSGLPDRVKTGFPATKSTSCA